MKSANVPLEMVEEKGFVIRVRLVLPLPGLDELLHRKRLVDVDSDRSSRSGIEPNPEFEKFPERKGFESGYFFVGQVVTDRHRNYLKLLRKPN